MGGVGWMVCMVWMGWGVDEVGWGGVDSVHSVDGVGCGWGRVGWGGWGGVVGWIAGRARVRIGVGGVAKPIDIWAGLG